MSAESIETDISRQDEEIEALASIYDQDFLVVNEKERLFDIRICHEDNSWWSVTLQILFPENYPSKVPPVFEIHGGWIADHDEVEIREKLDSTYCEDETVVFQWVEIIREFINEKALEYEIQQNLQEDTTCHNESSSDNNTDLSNIEVSSPTTMNELLNYAQDITYFTTQPDLPEMFHGEPLTDRKSTFQAHLAKVSSQQEMEDVVRELKSNRKIAHATHNIVAYRIKKKDSDIMIQDFDEDGEHNAGSRLLHLLQLLNVENYVVMVSRWYGGILLGPDRFKHINNCARNLLKTAKVIADNSTKHGNIHHKENKNKRKIKK